MIQRADFEPEQDAEQDFHADHDRREHERREIQAEAQGKERDGVLKDSS